MPGALEVGRVCVKVKGREAGNVVAIVAMDKGFATIDGAQVKRKRCNIRHLYPLKEKIAIKKTSTHTDVVKLLKKVQ